MAGSISNDPANLPHGLIVSGLRKSLASVWAPGNGGGLDVGSLAASTTYHIFQITQGGVADALASTSPVNPVLPFGWDRGAWIGAVRTDASGSIVPFLQSGRRFAYLDTLETVGLPIGAPRVVDVPVPVGIKLKVNMSIQPYGGGSGAFFSICDQDLGDAKEQDAVGVYGNASIITPIDIVTDCVARVNVRSNVSSSMNFYTRSWERVDDEDPIFTWGLLGTSLSLGISREHSYAREVNALLSVGKAGRVDCFNMSVDGGTSAQGVYQQIAKLRPDAVVIEYSMNDAVGTLANSQSRHTTIVNAIKSASPNTQIFLMTMNPLLGNSAPVQARSNLPSFYQLYRTLAPSLGVGLIDNVPAWTGATMTDLPDGMHPTISAHRARTVPGIVAALAPLVP